MRLSSICGLHGDDAKQSVPVPSGNCIQYEFGAAVLVRAVILAQRCFAAKFRPVLLQFSTFSHSIKLQCTVLLTIKIKYLNLALEKIIHLVLAIFSRSWRRWWWRVLSDAKNLF
jgi:hypothetical protein